MTAKLKIIRLPHLDSVVIKQEGGHVFISAPNSLIIGRGGFLELAEALLRIGFLTAEDISQLSARIGIENEN
jgi:hypothetical protein